MSEDPQDAAITARAPALHIEVIAQGCVERAAQYSVLPEQGCDFVQGLLMGRSPARDEMTAWFAALSHDADGTPIRQGASS